MYERNFRTHVSAAVLVYAISPYYHFSGAEMVLITLIISFVVVTEIINTSIETIVDMITNKYNELARIAKDVAAAGVLVSSICAVVCGCILLGRRDVLIAIYNDLTGGVVKPALMLLMIISLVMFVRGGNANKRKDRYKFNAD